MLHRWDWTRSPTEAAVARHMHSPSGQGRTDTKAATLGHPFTFLLPSHFDHLPKLMTNILAYKVT